MRSICFWMALFSALVIPADFPAPPLCTTKCRKGQLCFKDDCPPCPEGSFQNKERHTKTKCIPWTPKPSYGHPHWVLKKEGNSTSDRIWDCEDGYEVYWFTEDKETCTQKLTSTTPSPGTNSPVSPEPTTVTSSPVLSSDEESNHRVTTPSPGTNSPVSPEPTTVTSSPVLSSDEESNHRVIIGCSIGGLMLLTLVVIVLVFHRKKKFCFAKQRHKAENVLYKIVTDSVMLYNDSVEEPVRE